MNLQDFGVKRHFRLLENGIRFVLFERSNSPICLRAVFLGGSRYDPEGKHGLAHFAEHMFVAGTKKFPTKDKLAEYIEQYGGVHGGWTGKELMEINVEVAEAEDIDVAVEVLSEMLTNSLLAPKVIEIERKSIFRELGESISNPQKYINEVAVKLCFQATLVGRSILGEKSSLESINRDDLLRYSQNNMNAGRMALVCSGDIDFDILAKKVGEKLRIERGAGSVTTKQLPIIRKNPVLIERYDLEEVQFDLAFRTTSYFDEDTPVLRLISTLLGGGRASTLSRELRQERGLVYTVIGIAFGLQDSGVFSIRTSTSQKDFQEAVDVICAELNRVKTGGLTDEEIEFVKNKIIKSTKRNMQTSESWVDFHRYGELLAPDNYLTLDKYLDRVSSIQKKEVEWVANKYFQKDQWLLSICGDIQEKDVRIVL